MDHKFSPGSFREPLQEPPGPEVLHSSCRGQRAVTVTTTFLSLFSVRISMCSVAGSDKFLKDVGQHIGEMIAIHKCIP